MSEPMVPGVEVHWLDGELELPEHCLACGSNRLLVHHEGLQDLLGQVPGTWGFLQCRECRSLNLVPRPTKHAIAKAYPASYVTHFNLGAEAAGENGEGFAWSLVNGYANQRFGSKRTPSSAWGPWLVPMVVPVRQQMDYFFRHLPTRPGVLLDVGCGHGAFLDRAESAGWRVEGIEPDSVAANVARSRGIKVSVCSIDAFVPSEMYDRITLSHVFEHLHEPSRELATLHAWLRDEGELWMALPNPAGIGYRFFGRNWFSLDPPRHLLLAPPVMIRSMLVDAGFTSVEFIRRGRGSRSSLLPSMAYKKQRVGKGSTLLAKVVSVCVDVLSSMFVSCSEEIVVLAKKARNSGRD